MKKSLCLIFLSISTLYVCGQQVYIETGTAISAFHYKNSDGESLDNLFGSNNFFMQIGYHAVSTVNRLNYSAGISYIGYGASGSDSMVGNYFDWDTKYIGVDLGLDYEIIKKRFTTSQLSDLTVYIKLTISPEILVHGTQTINYEVYNLIGVEQFKYPFIFARGGAGISYSINRLVTVYAEYMGGEGFPLKIGDKKDKEKLWISNHNIGFGLYVNLPGYKSWK
ncbi:MAG: hypothetical protein NT092_10695 [Bacteroidia bacterium]|nr:hypothetical protein [Bacteroidia bacterium]